MTLRLICCTVWFLASIFAGYVNAYDPAPRWAQAAVVIDGVLYVHGGKSDPTNAYSYDGAPNVNDLIYLSLLDSFDTSAVPWQLLSNSSNSPASQGPPLAWHSISAFNTTHALLFGGELDPNSPTVLPDRPDSVVLLNCADKLNPSWTTEPQSWANEPTRRVNHRTTSSYDGKICLAGGEKADGSHLTFSSNYLFDPIAVNFTVIDDTNGPPDLIGHSAVLLGDGRILIFGGYCPSQQLEVPFSTIWILDTTQDPWTWSQLNISSSNLPTPRRGFAFAVLSNGDIIIHGGRSGDLSITYSDGWILNTSQNPMTWTEAPALSQLGARCDHFAVATGDLTLFGFGYGSNGPAPADVKVYDADSGSFVSTFSPPSPTPSPTVPGPSTTPKPTHHSATTTATTKHSTTTTHPSTDPTSTDTPGTDENRGHDKKGLAIALGAVFGALGLLLLAVGFYYLRRRSPAHRFMALEGGQGEGGVSLEDSPDREVSSMHDLHDFHPTRGEGLVATITGAVAALTMSRSRMIPERKDMLADEDTRDFGDWYNERRHDGTGGSSWSLRSILVGGRMRTREPSISSSFGRASRREKSDGMEDTTPLFDEGTSDTHTAGAVVGAAGVARTPYRRQLSYTSSRSYVDPFADPIAEEGNSYPGDGQRHDVPTVGGIPLAPLQEVSSNSNQSHQDLSPGSGLRAGSQLTVSSRNVLSPHVVSDTSGSSPSFGASSGEPTPPRLASTFFTNDTPTHQNMRRSDSWWTRFSRTSFLDRRPSASSKPVPEFRDPHPPPRLLAIEEGTHSPENTSPDSAKPSSQPPSPEAAGRGMYNIHNRSLTSVKTADTAAIERMAGVADVQMTRSQRRFSSSSEGTSTLFHDRPVSWAPSGSEDGDPVKEQEEAPVVSSQSSHGSRVTGRTRTHQPEDQDGGVAEDGSTKSRDKGDKQSSNTVRLVQRPSLFVANPDHRLSTSNDSSH